MDLRRILAELDEARRSGRLDKVAVEISIDGDVSWGEAAPILCEVGAKVIPSFLPDVKLPPTERRLVGVAIDSKGKGVPGVRVDIFDEWMPGASAPMKSVETDESGRFEVEGLGEGLYRLVFDQEGYAKGEMLVLINPRSVRAEMRRRVLMIKGADELPEFEFSPPFRLKLPYVERAEALPALVHPVVYIGADGKAAVDGEVIGRPDISALYDKLSEKPSMFWTVIAADRRAKWGWIAEVLTEEMMRGMASAFLMVE